MIGYPPGVPQRTNWVSPWAVAVGPPVAGPSRCTSTMTSGISLITARPMFSLYRLMPGPLVAVMALAPAETAPMHMPMEAISSSPWTATPPAAGSWRIIMPRMPEAGVIG